MRRDYYLVSKIARWAFAAIGFSSLVLAFWHGQLHHMLIAMICCIMCLILLPEKAQEKEAE